MRLRQIEVFHALMTSASMTEAAERLHVSQPAISQVLKHAEQSLGFRLFTRLRGRLVPTPEALALLPDVEDIFNRIEALDRAAHGLRKGAAGTVTISAVPAVASFVLPAVMRSFKARHPQAHIVVRALSNSQVQSTVREAKSDFGLVYQPAGPLDATLAAQTVFKGRVVCVVPRDHALARRRFVDPVALADYPLITFGPQSALRAQIDACFAARAVDNHVAIESSSSLAAIFLVASGLGVALVETAGMVAHFPDLMELPFRPQLPTSVVLLERAERPRAPLAAAFLRHLQEVQTTER